MPIQIDKAKGLLKTAGATIRAQGRELDELRAKLASYEKEKRAMHLAQLMEEKGLEADKTVNEKVAALMSSNLEVAEQAIKMASVGGNLFGTPSEESSAEGGAESAFLTFIATGE